MRNDTLSPGEHLDRVHLKPNGLSPARGAVMLDIAPSTMSRLMSGRAQVSADMAVRLEFVFGEPAEDWLARQARHSLQGARDRVDTRELVSLAELRGECG